MAYIPSDAEEALFLQNFDATKYKNPAVAADTALFALDADTVKILLIQRGGYPYKNCWALPGGFVNIDEDIRDSAARELAEETGLAGIYAEQAFVWGRVDRDPRQRVITVSYIALAEYARLRPKAGDDAARAEWFAIEDYRKQQENGTVRLSYTLRGVQTLCPVVQYPAGRMQEITRIESGGLAFDHAESIAYSYECLKQRIRCGPFLAFSLDSERLRAHAREIILRD